MDKITNIILESVRVKNALKNDKIFLSTISSVSEIIINLYKEGKKVLICGNGGSAADAQHISAEFTGRFYKDREPLFSEALHVNSSYLTAVANDYSFEEVYSRLVKAKGVKGDVLIALSTSGNSKNVINAIKESKKLGIVTVGLTGHDGGNMKDICDYMIMIPSSDTPRIQESHIMVGHIICELVEDSLFSDD